MRLLVARLSIVLAVACVRPSAAPRATWVGVLVRRADGSGPVTVHVALHGRLGHALTSGPEGVPVTEVHGAATVTLPATLMLWPEPGVVTFSVEPAAPIIEVLVPETGLRARGSIVRLVRDRAGSALRIEAIVAARK